jgi:hypothetical protein
MGLTEVSGFVYTEDEFLVLEVESAFLGMVGKNRHTVKVEPVALKDIWLERRPFKDRLCMRPKKPDLLEAMPGDHSFELTLRIWKIYRKDVQRLVDEVAAMREIPDEGE